MEKEKRKFEQEEQSNEHEQNESKNEEVVENKKKFFKDKLQKQEDEINKLRADQEHWKNEYYKAYADMQNLRKSLEKDYKEAMKYRTEGFIADLLPVLDGFHLALLNEPTTPEMKNYLTGFQYLYNNLVSILENEGVKETSPKIGDKFDEKTMHAIDIEINKDKEENIVARVNANGYTLHNHMIRPAMVVVTKKEAPKQNDDQSATKLDA